MAVEGSLRDGDGTTTLPGTQRHHDEREVNAKGPTIMVLRSKDLELIGAPRMIYRK